jgi:glutamyl endopeptidase
LDGSLLTASVGVLSTDPSPGTVADSRSVIGPNKRGQVTDTTAFPFRAVGAVDGEGVSNSCTGWLVSPDTVVTAGHCVSSYGAPIADFHITPGRNGNRSPWGTATASEVWFDRSFDVIPGHDWGIVKLRQPIGDTVGWIGLQTPRQVSFAGSTVSISGYPSDKPAGTLWSASGDVESQTASRLLYSIDTYGGQSGSAVYQNGRAIGIHVTGGKKQRRNYCF